MGMKKGRAMRALPLMFDIGFTFIGDPRGNRAACQLDSGTLVPGCKPGPSDGHPLQISRPQDGHTKVAYWARPRMDAGWPGS